MPTQFSVFIPIKDLRELSDFLNKWIIEGYFIDVVSVIEKTPDGRTIVLVIYHVNG